MLRNASIYEHLRKVSSKRAFILVLPHADVLANTVDCELFNSRTS